MVLYKDLTAKQKKHEKEKAAKQRLLPNMHDLTNKWEPNHWVQMIFSPDPHWKMYITNFDPETGLFHLKAAGTPIDQPTKGYEADIHYSTCRDFILDMELQNLAIQPGNMFDMEKFLNNPHLWSVPTKEIVE